MPYTRQWTASLGLPLSSASIGLQGQNFMFQLYQAFSGSRHYTVTGMSNFSSASMTGNTIITSSTDFRWRTNGTGPFSWFIVTNNSGTLPSGNRIHMLFACSSSATDNSGSMYNVISLAPFTTGGVSTMPSASTLVNKTFAGKRFIRPGPVAQRYSVISSSGADFIFTLNPAALNRYSYTFAIFMAGNYEPFDGYPLLGINSFCDEQPGSLTLGPGGTCLHLTQSVMFYHDGLGVCSQGDGPDASGSYGILNYFMTSSAQYLWSQNSSALQAFTNGGSHISGYYPDLPAILMSSDVDHVGLRGRLVDISVGPQGANVQQGTVSPATGDPQYGLFGHLWLPVSGQIPQI